MARRATQHDAVIDTPFGRLGIALVDGRLASIDFLSGRVALKSARDSAARRAVAELRAYCRDAGHRFHLALAAQGSAHQRRVWRALRAIPRGEVRTYGELARMIGSSARAVGNACRTNPLPIVVPCHRVVSAGGLGGFMGRRAGAALALKRQLLAHEQS